MTVHVHLSILLSAFLGMLSACASYTDEVRDVRSEYVDRRYKEALEKLNASPIASQERNRLLFMLEKAMILDRMAERDESRKLLIAADILADKLYTVSVSREIATYVYNESAQEYAGEDYEKVAMHTIAALSFIQDEKLDAARVEAKRINTKLMEINDKYKEKKNRYSEDALARYLAGLIYEAKGEWDDAIIDYTKALALYEGLYAKEFATSAPRQLIEALYGLLVLRSRSDRLAQLKERYPEIVKGAAEVAARRKNQGQIVVIHEYETITPKHAFEFAIPIAGQIVRLSFPQITPTRYRPQGMGLSAEPAAGNVQHAEAEMFQNMDEIASKTLDDRRMRLILKQGARLLVKGQITRQAYDQFGPLGGIAANVYSVVTETADTRQWNTLPRAFMVSRLWLDKGKYKLRVKNRGRIADAEEVELDTRKIVIRRDVG